MRRSGSLLPSTPFREIHVDVRHVGNVVVVRENPSTPFREIRADLVLLPSRGGSFELNLLLPLGRFVHWSVDVLQGAHQRCPSTPFREIHHCNQPKPQHGQPDSHSPSTPFREIQCNWCGSSER